MRYKLLSPTARDLCETELAIRSFPGAYGSITRAGEFRPSIADSRMLSIYIPITSEAMTNLWRGNRISTDSKSAFAKMQVSREHCIDVNYFKLKRGWLGSMWIGNVKLGFDKSQIAVGSLGGASQASMWHQLRKFTDNEINLYDSTDAAINAGITRSRVTRRPSNVPPI